jgi:hypothetical protein
MKYILSRLHSNLASLVYNVLRTSNNGLVIFDEKSWAEIKKGRKYLVGISTIGYLLFDCTTIGRNSFG